MPRRMQTVTMYCHDPACEGAHGVTVGIHPATRTEPADLDRDDCEHCGQLVHGEPLPACGACEGCGDRVLGDDFAACLKCNGTGFIIPKEEAA